jgi:hypothetical protein
MAKKAQGPLLDGPQPNAFLSGMSPMAFGASSDHLKDMPASASTRQFAANSVMWGVMGVLGSIMVLGGLAGAMAIHMANQALKGTKGSTSPVRRKAQWGMGLGVSGVVLSVAMVGFLVRHNG